MAVVLATPFGHGVAEITHKHHCTNSEMTNAMQKAKVNTDEFRDQSLEKMALEDCEELIGLSIEELQSGMPMEDVGDARSSMSAVIAYQRACLEGLKESLAYSQVAKFLFFLGGSGDDVTTCVKCQVLIGGMINLVIY